MVKLVYGVGINDADYVVQPKVDGRQQMCPIYLRWKSMLQRCYCTKYQQRQPTYLGCHVSEDWLLFSNFKGWLETQNWQNRALDKDLLVEGNKLYSPRTCVLLDQTTNNFILDSKKLRGSCLIGVYFDRATGKYVSACSNPFNKQKYKLGYFKTELEAHKAWQAKKHEYACQLADLQEDTRVAEALRQRYAPDKDWTKG